MDRILAAAFALLVVSPAVAQQPSAASIFGVDGKDLVLEIGVGAKVIPAYEGADQYTVMPWPIVDLHFFRLPGIGTFGGGPSGGLDFAPSFRFVRERDASDYSDLTGLGDIGLAVEIGGTIGYRQGMFRGFGTLRRGFGGHDGLVAELGLEAIFDQNPDFTFSVGPRVYLASDNYMDTYFGITPAEPWRQDIRRSIPTAG